MLYKFKGFFGIIHFQDTIFKMKVSNLEEIVKNLPDDLAKRTLQGLIIEEEKLYVEAKKRGYNPEKYQGPYYILLAKQFAERKKGEYRPLHLNKVEIKSLLLQYLQITSEIKLSLDRIGKKDGYFFVEADIHKLRRSSFRVL